MTMAILFTRPHVHVCAGGGQATHAAPLGGRPLHCPVPPAPPPHPTHPPSAAPASAPAPKGPIRPSGFQSGNT